jgi:integral membrane protein (TIGR00529 family)
MDLLLNVPVIIKVLVSLGLFIIINSVVKNLLIALSGGTLLLAVWAGHSLETILSIIFSTLVSLNSFFLYGVIFFVIWLSSQMEKTGLLKELVAGIKARFSRRVAIAALPAVIGLLPMPGGAQFSAPLVDECDEEKDLAPDLKTRINFWFRHIWEYWWPLYPGVLTAIAPQNFNLPLWLFIPVQLPLCIFSIFAGYQFILRKVKAVPCEENKEKKSLFMPFLPIMVIAVVYLGIKIIFPQAEVAISNYFPFFIGLPVAILVLQILRPLSFTVWAKIIFSLKTLYIVALVVMTTVFGGFIQAELPSGIPLMVQMKHEFDAVGIPVILIIMVLPLLGGLTTGLTIGFVGASFPIVASLLGATPLLSEKLATLVLAYGFGYVGIILSPVHTCLVLSNKYFNTSLAQSIFKMIPPSLVVLAGSICLYYFIRALGF